MSTSKSPAATTPPKARMLVEAQKKYGKLVQMGTQQRSSPHTIEIVDKIHNGLIGRAYYGEGLVQQHAQVHRRRQGSARARHARLGSLAGPRAAPAYKDNVQPYNWHWFRSGAPAKRSTTARTKSTSAAGRSASTIPNRITASGGRYHSRTTGSSTTPWSPTSTTTTR